MLIFNPVRSQNMLRPTRRYLMILITALSDYEWHDSGS